MRILGLSAFYHDSAAVLIEDGRIVAGAQEERFSRRKFDADFPAQSVAYCLSAARCDMGGIDVVAYYEQPSLKLSRQIDTFLDFAPRGPKSFLRFAAAGRSGKFRLRRELERHCRKLPGGETWNGVLDFRRHHESHAASAFYPSPFAEAAILTVDGVGESETTTIWRGKDAALQQLHSIHFPHSLGLLYSAVTAYLGFRVNSDEYKVMGLAPYGRPRFADLMRREMIDLKDDGSYRLNLDYFSYMTSDRMVTDAFCAALGAPVRRAADPVDAFHADVAASLQQVTTEAMLALAATAVRESGSRNLCLSGGVALNCVANGKILAAGLVDRIFIQPAAGDAGSAIGAALAAYYARGGVRSVPQHGDSMAGSRLGPAFTRDQVVAVLRRQNAPYHELAEPMLLSRVAVELNAGKVVGWFDGRMEFGPRALGGRSIIADARRPEMQQVLNLKVKFRESFRPFAPIVLAEDVSQWFELRGESPYMLIVADVAPHRRVARTGSDGAAGGLSDINEVRSQIPAVTHIDNSARVQTIDKGRAPRLHALLTTFKQLTGCPVLVNTSFNVADEVIVCTPEDAYRCFMSTDIDVLVLGNCLLLKEEQPADWVFTGALSARVETPTIPDFNYTLY